MGPDLSIEPLQKHSCFFDAFSYGIERLPLANIHSLYLTFVRKQKRKKRGAGPKPRSSYLTKQAFCKIKTRIKSGFYSTIIIIIIALWLIIQAISYICQQVPPQLGAVSLIRAMPICQRTVKQRMPITYKIIAVSHKQVIS